MRRSHALAPRLAVALVIAAACYTAFLCFMNTHVGGVSNGVVALFDGAIILGALFLALRAASRTLWMLLFVLAANFLLLAMFSDALDLKAVRDPLVLIAFTALGLFYGTFERARFTFYTISAIVIAIGLFEYIAPAEYTSLFNVIGFYNARGMVTADTLQRLDSAFFVSGAREGERMLLPFLGSHRVSSIFLEPVSMGNFGALAFAFALSLGRAHWRTAAIAATIGLAAIILADARFASMAVMFFLLARLVPAKWRQVGLALLPLIAIALLISFGLSDLRHGDDLPTRLASSGRTLLEMSPQAVFGLSPSTETYDAGYAYAFGSFGLPLCILLWAAFVLLPTPTPEASRYKFLLGVYVCALLCISGSSAFALKTAALAFFALGALASQGLKRKVPARRLRVAPWTQERHA